MRYLPTHNVTGGYRVKGVRREPARPLAAVRDLAPEGLALSGTPDGLAAITLTDRSGTSVSLGFAPATATQIALDLAALAAALSDGA